MRPYLAVFQTYRRRPLFRWLAVACVAWHAAIWLEIVWHRIGFRVGLWNDFVFTLIWLAGDGLRVCLPVVLGVAWTAHVREQFAGERKALVPGYVPLHVRVAKVALAGLAVAVPLIWLAIETGERALDLLYVPPGGSYLIERGPWFAGGLIISVMLTVLASLSATFGKPWVSLTLAPLVLIGRLASGLDPWDWYRSLSYRYDVYDRINSTVGTKLVTSAVTPIIIASTVGPLVVVAIARAILWRRINAIASVPGSDGDSLRAPSSPATVSRRLALTTTWARVRHRRSPVLSGWAPSLVGLLLAIVLSVFPASLFDAHNPATQLRISLILATVLPAVAVGCIWAERWPRVAAESLLPATRRQFVAETAAAVGLDLAAFWAAIAVGVTVPLVVFPAEPVDWGTLAARLGASALVQGVALAAVLWGLVLRSWPALATMLGAALTAMSGPLLMASKREPMVPVELLVPVSVGIAVVGGAMMWLACRRLVRGNLA